MSDYRPETLALHAGHDARSDHQRTRRPDLPDDVVRVRRHRSTPQTCSRWTMPGNIYTRIMNPTWDVLRAARRRARGRHRRHSPLASGQAAVTYSVLNVTRAGDNIVAVSTLYGGTYNLFAHTLPQYGIEVRFVDPDDPEASRALVDDKTRLVFAETIGNPKLNVVDITAWADAAHAPGPAADRRQHRARRRSLRASSSTAPTSSCTRRRSTSAATAPRSAA